MISESRKRKHRVDQTLLTSAQVSIDGEFPGFRPVFLFSFVDKNADGFRRDIEILADRFGDILYKPSFLLDGSPLIRLDNDQWHVFVPPAGFWMRIGKPFRYVKL
jgi:hypothetical protein